MKLTFCAVVVFIAVLSPAGAETLTCSTSFQGYRVCSGPGDFVGFHYRVSRCASAIWSRIILAAKSSRTASAPPSKCPTSAVK
jgi:hypothetical protein